MQRLESKKFKFEDLIEDPETRTIVKSIVLEAISEGIRAHCRLPINDQDAPQIGYFVDGVKMRGGGDFHAGIEELFDNHDYVSAYRQGDEHEERMEDHRWVRRTRQRWQTMSMRIGSAILTAGALAVFSLLGFGIKAWLDRGGS